MGSDMPANTIGKVRFFVNGIEITDFVCGVSVEIGEDPQVSIWTKDAEKFYDKVTPPTLEVTLHGKWSGAESCKEEER